MVPRLLAARLPTTSLTRLEIARRTCLQPVWCYNNNNYVTPHVWVWLPSPRAWCHSVATVCVVGEGTRHVLRELLSAIMRVSANTACAQSLNRYHFVFCKIIRVKYFVIAAATSANPTILTITVLTDYSLRFESTSY